MEPATNIRGVIAVVVLHFPEQERLTKNLRALNDAVDEIVLIDNSQPAIAWLTTPGDKKITVIKNSGNKAVAASLNIAARYAIDKDVNWLVTMDQDSVFAEGDAKKLVEFALNTHEKVGVCSPTFQSQRAGRTRHVRFAMMSGSVLNLHAWQQCGPFDENLFIDSVDHEYCLRLRKAGWKILRNNETVLVHSPGRKVEHHLAGIRIQLSEHPAWRHYFIARNRLVVMFRYLTFDPVFFVRELFEYPKQLLKIIMFESDKRAKLKYMFRGIFHFLAGRFVNHA